MLAPDFLYRLNARDEDSAVIQVYSADLLVQNVGPNLTARFNGIQNDQVMIVTTVACYGIPNAAESIVRMAAWSEDSGNGNDIWFWSQDSGGAAGGSAYGASWQGEYLVMPGYHVTVQADFSAAGVGAHAMQCWVHGIVLPRGNILEF